jgi:hypothetical protein
MYSGLFGGEPGLYFDFAKWPLSRFPSRRKQWVSSRGDNAGPLQLAIGFGERQNLRCSIRKVTEHRRHRVPAVAQDFGLDLKEIGLDGDDPTQPA